jgi:hypothetical protein
VALGGIALALAPAAPVSAGRCQSGLGGGLHCGACPDEATIQNLAQTKCQPGWLPVIYDLDKPFFADNSTSNAIIRSTPNSLCPGLEKTVPMSGYIVGCWSPPNSDGCREFKIINNGTWCLEIGGGPLGADCPACADVSTDQISIVNAGAADHKVCPPHNEGMDPGDPQYCRARRSLVAKSEAKFRLWAGGFCSTNSCEGDQPGADTCVSQWGATYFGYNRPPSNGLPPGWFDWKTGSFKVVAGNGKATCGKLGECLGEGRTAPWTLTVVATPRPTQSLPCLRDSTNPCDPAGCAP